MREHKIQQHFAVLSIIAPEKVEPAVKAMYTQFFVDLETVAETADFMPSFEKVVGKNIAAEVSKKAGSIGKDMLAKNTEQAIDDEAFGLPWILGMYKLIVYEKWCLTEVQATNSDGKAVGFWGVDHLGQVLDHLGLEIPRGESWRTVL